MAPNIVTYMSNEVTSRKIYESLFAAFSVSSFLSIWIMSLFSPLIFIFTIRSGYFIASAIIALITYQSYAKWNKGLLSQIISSFYFKYHSMYYKKLKVDFEGTALPSPSDPQTFYAIHPHGAFSFGWAILFNSSILSHVRFCFAPALYMSPFFRLFSRVIGNPGSANKQSMIQYLKAGEHLALPPGGFEEATLTSTETDRVFIKKRHGFIRLCLKYGVCVRPVYVFGEKSLFSNFQAMKKFRLGLNRMGLPALLVWGEPLIPFLPKRNKSMYIVVGEPIMLPKIENPSKDEVAQWHGKYITALTRIFDEYKETAYGEEGKTMKLEIW